MKRWALTVPINRTKMDGTPVAFTHVKVGQNVANFDAEEPNVRVKFYLCNDNGDQIDHSWQTYTVPDLPAEVQAALATFMNWVYPDLNSKRLITAGEVADLQAPK